MVKLASDDLRDILSSPATTDREIDSAVRTVEDLLQHGLQQYPEDQFLLTAESDYSRLLNDHERSFDALKRAFNANRRETYIAFRLARLCEDRGSLVEAEQILYDALQANRGDHQLNFQYAGVLRKRGEAEQAVLLYHYRRSFTKLDTNFEAQFWFARYAFESPNPVERAESKETFKQLRSAPLPFDVRRQIRDCIARQGTRLSFFGTITRLEFTHGFVARDGSGDYLFFHKNDDYEDEWLRLRPGLRVDFNICFSFNGAVATIVTPV